jgi:hypothetical protein
MINHKNISNQLLKDPNDKDISWIEFNIGRALNFKSEWNYKLARIKDSACVLNNIGGVFDDQDKFEEAIHHYQRSLKMKEKCFPSAHVDIARSLINIDSISYRRGRMEVSN